MSEKVVSSPVDEQVELNLSDGKITDGPPPAQSKKKKAAPRKKTPLPTAAEVATERADQEAEEAQAPAIIPGPGPPTVIERMMEKVIGNPDVDVDKLERVIAIYEKERDDKRRVEFHAHFAELQADLEPVARTKNVDDKFDYAPIEGIVETVGKIVNGHGFSYRFPEEDLPPETVETDDGKKQLKKMRRYWFIISGYGHEEKNSVDLPEYIGNSTGKFSVNEAQQRGQSMSYGRRYSMIAGLGITFKNLDDETIFSADEVLDYAKHIAAMRAAPSGKEMITAFREGFAELSNDQPGQMKLTKIKEQLKREWIAVQKEIDDAGRDD